MSKYSNTQLLIDLVKITRKNRNYMMFPSDCFALGYLAGKYGLNNFLEDKDALIKACQEYDKTDELGIFDTIAETLIDLEVITGEQMYGRSSKSKK